MRRCRYGNRVERNHLSQLAQTTRDLGGVSFIGQGHTDTVVRHNCVRDVIGMDIDDSGRLMRPFYSWGVYLDNFATGFRVESNILNGNVLGGVFIHGGSSNAIVNNILYRSSNTSMPGPGHYGHVRCVSSLPRNSSYTLSRPGVAV
jgi:nitrous oxidase accessory protein NosD